MEITREKAITRTSIIGILANILLAAFKAVAGLVAGSIAIVLDAVNNLTDALSSIITILGIKLAKRSPNDKHPFGYGRIEYFSTILISFLVLFAGISSIIESVKKIIAPEVPAYSVVTVVIIVVSVFVKLFLGRFVKGQGEKYNSDALVASGSDASFDAIISASTLVGAVITLLFHISVDGIIGAIISCFIIKAGLEMLLEALSDVLGARADSELTKEIKADIRQMPNVLGAYDLIIHNYGPESAVASVHVEIPSTLTANEIHKLQQEIMIMIHQKYHMVITVGIYSVDSEDVEIKTMREAIMAHCKELPGVINSHGYYFDREKKHVTLDIMVDFTVKDKAGFVAGVKQAIQEICGYTADIGLDTNYSD